MAAVQRILRGAAATLTYVHEDANGVQSTPASAPTVGVTRSDGTVLIAAGTASTTVSPGVYSVALTAAQTATLDELTATWTIGGVTAAARTTTHLIVGGFMFSIADLRAFEPGLEDELNYPATAVIAARCAVEDEVEWICDRSFVPKYERVTINGTGDTTVLTGVPDIRTVRSLRVYSAPGSSSYTSFTAGQLAQLTWTADGELRRNDSDVFDVGFGTVVVELEHWYQLTDDMRNAALLRCASILREPNSAVPDRATRYQRDDGWEFDLTGGDDEFTTGIPDVDRVYGRRSRRKQGKDRRDRPASRQLNFDPQYAGLYRGGRA